MKYSRENEKLQYENSFLAEKLGNYNKLIVELGLIQREYADLKKELASIGDKSTQPEKLQTLEKELENTKSELERKESHIKDIQEECNKLCEEISNYENKLKILNSLSEENESLKNKLLKANENQESHTKRFAKALKGELKKKFKLKEERLKSEINNSIEEIQKTIKSNSIEYSKIKKENAELQNRIQALELALKYKESNHQSYEEKNMFLQEKLEITESTLKKKINEKSLQVNAISKQYSDLERKSLESQNDFANRERQMQEIINKLQSNQTGEVSEMAKNIEYLKAQVIEKSQQIEALEQSLENANKSLAQAISDKKALETSISDLEITLKHLDIQQTRQSLEELSVLRHKLQQELEGKKEFQENFERVRKKYENLQEKVIRDAQFFKIETSRKDQDFSKIKNYCDSKIKEKDAEFAIRNEEIRSELNAVLGELISNDVSLECCGVLEQIIQSLE